MKSPSLKINFLWAFAGNAFYALCGYLLLTLLTKTSSVETVGLWGIGQAVTLPVATFFSLKLCTVNITDVRNEYQTGHYVAVRLLASLVSVAVAAAVGFVFYPLQTAVIISLMGVSQSAAEIRAYFMSNLQKYERLSLATLAQLIEGVLTLALFGVVFWFTQNLVWAILGTIVSRLVVLLCYDIPVSYRVTAGHLEGFSGYRPLWQGKIVWRLIRYSAPLAVVAATMNVSQNIPRLVMDTALGREAVGYFTALSMLLVAFMMVNAAMGNAALPRLSKYFAQNISAFIRLMGQLIVLNVGLGALFAGVLAVFGRPLLTLLFTADYAHHKDILVMLGISSCLLSVFAVSNWGLNATRQFGVQVPIYIGTAIVSGVCSMLLIPRFGMMGGAYAFIASYIFGAIACLIFTIKAVKEKKYQL